MSKKVTIVITIAIAAMLLFSACERSASKPMKATPTAGGSNPTPKTTSLSLVQSWGTTTAMYVQTAVAMGTMTAAPASETPQANLTPTPVGTISTPLVPPTGVATSTPAPGTTLVIVVPTATPGRPASYALHAGEFPYCLARRFDVNPDTLLSMNNLADGQILQPGLTLNIPQTGSFPGNRALRPHPAQYTSKVNDTFYSVACYFGDVDPTAIAAANNLTISSTLITGTVLNIP